jgi:hypothetical protein
VKGKKEEKEIRIYVCRLLTMAKVATKPIDMYRQTDRQTNTPIDRLGKRIKSC